MNLPSYSKFIALFFAFNLSILSSTFSQVGIGKWREHLPYSYGLAICKADNKIYCAAYPSLYYYDTNDNSIEKLSKVNGLSDIGVSVVKYCENYKTLIIGYDNGNIDLIIDEEITNVPDIKRTSIQGDKSVNEILIKNELAYISTGFGIIVFDVSKKEIRETYVIGPGGKYITVNELAIQNDTLFAATSDGVYYGNMLKNLADFQNWTKMSGLPEGNFNTIASFDNTVVTNFQFLNGYEKDTAYVFKGVNWEKINLGSAYRHGDINDINISDNNLILIAYDYGSDVLGFDFETMYRLSNYGGGLNTPIVNEIIEHDGKYWLADKDYAMMHGYGEQYQNYKPTGPVFSDSWGMDYSKGHLWVTTGSLTTNMKYAFSNRGIAEFFNDEWKSYYGGTVFDSLRDIHAIAIHPDDPNHVFACSFGGGLLEFKNGSRVKIYNETNSSIQSISLFPFRPIGGLSFDSSKNLWITNSGLVGQSIANPLVVSDLKGNWYSFSLNNILNSSSLLSKIIIDKNGNKWMSSYLKGIVVFNENKTLDNTADDQQTLLTVGESSGNLPSNEIFAMAEDADGKIWIGGSSGLAVFNSPQNVFEDRGISAERFIIQQDSTANYLLSDETINVIKINSANQKWIGTKSAGVYLMSADMQEEIHHFTSLNTPLLSDNIYDIELNDQTGEVYFATEKGLISFMGSATDTEKYDGPAYAFPNPVPPGYIGTIGVRGLPNNSEVKITDISGNLIYETIAEGGTATWDGKSLNGKKAQSGVYIVFASKSDGSQKQVVKILFLN